jgi:hypothetical protein
MRLSNTQVYATAVLVCGLTATNVNADPVTTDLFYTTSAGPPNNVNKAVVTLGQDCVFDCPTRLTIDSITPLASLPGADGIIFTPDGDLLIGGGTQASSTRSTRSRALLSATASSPRVTPHITWRWGRPRTTLFASHCAYSATRRLVTVDRITVGFCRSNRRSAIAIRARALWSLTNASAGYRPPSHRVGFRSC